MPAAAPTYLYATALLVAVWSLVAQGEWLANLAGFRAGGMFAGPGGRIRGLRGLMTPGGIALLSVVRLSGAAILLVPAGPGVAAIGFALVALSAPAIPLGLDVRDGSDKMGQIVSVAGLLAALGLWCGDPALAFAGVLLAGGQLTICYFVSGASKLARPEWRDGRVLDMVMTSETFGHRHAAAITRSHAASIAICWALMLAEALFPLTLLAPAPLLWGALGVFLIFHLATAYFMGLNTFVWAFAATFPATLLLGAVVRL